MRRRRLRCTQPAAAPGETRGTVDPNGSPGVGGTLGRTGQPRECIKCRKPLPEGLVGYPMCPACQTETVQRSEESREREVVPGITEGELMDSVRALLDRMKPPS